MAVPARGAVEGSPCDGSAGGSRFFLAADRRARVSASSGEAGHRGLGCRCHAPAAAGRKSAGVGPEAAARSRYGSSAGPGSETAAEPGGGSGLRGSRAPCPAAAAAVDEQAVDRIRDGIQGRSHDRQGAERVHHAPPVRMPRSVADPLVSAASMRAESCCSCHRKAEASPCRTSSHHRSATAAIVRLRSRTATPAGPAGAATLHDLARPRQHVAAVKFPSGRRDDYLGAVSTVLYRRLRAALSWMRYPALSAQIAQVWAGSPLPRNAACPAGASWLPRRPRPAAVAGLRVTWPGGLACRAR